MNLESLTLETFQFQDSCFYTLLPNLQKSLESFAEFRLRAHKRSCACKNLTIILLLITMFISTLIQRVRSLSIKSASKLRLTDLPDDALLSILQCLPMASIVSLLHLNRRLYHLGRYQLGRRTMLVLNAITTTGTGALYLGNLLPRISSLSLCNLEVNLGLIVLLDRWMSQLTVLQLSNLTFESPSICRALWTQLTTGMCSLKNLQLIDMQEMSDVPTRLVPFFSRLDHLTVIGSLSTVDRLWLLSEVATSGVFQSLTMDFGLFFWHDVYVRLASKPLQLQQIHETTIRGEGAIDILLLHERGCIQFPSKFRAFAELQMVVIKSCK